jgi:hypothetical protein
MLRTEAREKYGKESIVVLVRHYFLLHIIILHLAFGCCGPLVICQTTAEIKGRGDAKGEYNIGKMISKLNAEMCHWLQIILKCCLRNDNFQRRIGNSGSYSITVYQQKR